MNHLKLVARVNHPSPSEFAERLIAQSIPVKVTNFQQIIVDLPPYDNGDKKGVYLIPALIVDCQNKKILISCAEHRYLLEHNQYEDTIFCTSDGKKISPFFVPRHSEIQKINLANALFTISGSVVSVQAFSSHRQIVLTKHHLTGLEKDRVNLSSITLWHGYPKVLPKKFKRFSLAIEAASLRRERSCCLEPFFAN